MEAARKKSRHLCQAILVLFTTGAGCTAYRPAAVHVGSFADQGRSQVSAFYGTTGLAAHGSHALTDRLSVRAAAQGLNNEYQDRLVAGDVGLGLYARSTAKRRVVGGVSLDLGGGRVRHDQRNDCGRPFVACAQTIPAVPEPPGGVPYEPPFRGSFVRGALQVEVGRAGSFFSNAAVLRTQFVHLLEDARSQEPRRTHNVLYLTPVWVMRAGRGRVRFESQLGLRVPVGEPPYDIVDTPGIVANVGLITDF